MTATISRKGDFQMSLGFIIAVVFAVVLLTLAIVWLQGIIGDIGGVTNDLTQLARSELTETFHNTQRGFDISPRTYDLAAGKGVRLLAGIRNRAPDGRSHKFVINVIPSAASSNVCPGNNVAACNPPEGSGTMSTYMRSWVTYDSLVTPVQIQEIGFKDITIKTPRNAPQGTYIFKVVACYDGENAAFGVPSSEECQPDSDDVWSTTQELTIEVI